MTETQMNFAATRAMAAYPPPPLETAALTVKRCMLAMSVEAERATADGATAQDRRRRAQVAFKLYMPAMCDRPSIQAYIACVAQGIQVKAFTGNEGSQLLYAAQIALSLVRGTEKEKQPAKRAPRRAPTSRKEATA